MRNVLLRAKSSAFLAVAASAALADIPAGYPGKPYQDSLLEIPGRVRLFRFDEGPKEVVWHDFEASNKWYCKVRSPAAVGLQLMGAGGDKWEPGKAEPGMSLVQNDCYLAQTNTGDWTKYTVRVKEKGTYALSFLEAANGTPVPHVGVSFLTSKDSLSTGRITLPLTSYFHNWVYARNLATIALDTGLYVMRFDIVGNGPMNVNYIDFAPATGVGVSRPDAAVAAAAPVLRRALRLPDGRLRLSVEAPRSGPLEVTAFDAAGKPLWSHALPGDSGLREADLIPSRATHGVVFLSARQGSLSSPVRAYFLGR